MGRPPKQIDEAALLEMRGDGKTLKEISKEMGVSIPTLSRRLAVLNHAGLLTKYRELQGLQLTALQAKILSAIDFDHIEKASLIDIANALYVITKAEQSIKGKASGKMRGLVEHIQALENEK
jgi:DNA-binding MarR family transcriptional regulator